MYTRAHTLARAPVDGTCGQSLLEACNEREVVCHVGGEHAVDDALAHFLEGERERVTV